MGFLSAVFLRIKQRGLQMKMQYGFDDRVPGAKAVPWALQYVFTIFTGAMTGSIMLASGMGLNAEQTAFLIQCGLLACGVATLIHSFGLKIGGFQIGARLPLVSAGSYTLITPMILFATDPDIGISGAFGAAILGTALLFLVGPLVVEKLYDYFTPAVTGSVVLAVGMCLILNAWNSMVDYAPQSPDALKFFIIGIVVMILCIVIDHFAKGMLQSLAILIVLAAGYIFCALTGMVDFSPLKDAAWISLPKPLAFGFSVNIGAVITVMIVHIATMMEECGNTAGVVSAVEDQGVPSKETLKGAIRGDGLGGMLSSLFNALPVCIAAQNSGIVMMSGVASRLVTGIAGAIFVLMAVFPKFSQLLALIPGPVLGGVLLVIFGNTIASGIKVIGFDKMTKRNLTIVAMATSIGIGGNFAQQAGLLVFLPATVITLFTGISGTAVTALLLNLILPGKNEKA